MKSRATISSGIIAAGCALAIARGALAQAGAAELSVETLSGGHSVVAHGGDLISARVRFDAPVGVVFNAAMFRIVVTDGVAATTDSWQLASYGWHAPFVTHGPGDFSLHGLATPLEVTPPTLQGNGLPIDTADIDFAVFDFFQYAEPGVTLDFSFRLPANAPTGQRYLVAAVPDQFTAGFLGIPTDIGFIMDVLVGDPGQTPPTAVLNSVSNTTCGLANGAIDISVSFAQSLQWIGPNGFTSTSEDLANLAPGTYSLQATGPGGTASLSVQVSATPDASAPVVTSYTPSGSAPASASCTAPVPDLRASVVATDNCTAAAAIVVTQSPAPNTQRGIGTHQIQLTATDASGNATTVNAVFTVTGTQRTYYADDDGDGFGNPLSPAASCATAPPLHFASNAGDCNDASGQINPARPELCDGIDNDCSGVIDDGVVFSDFYVDADGDGFGDVHATAEHACLPPAGKVINNADCNDSDPTIRPSAIERCADIGTDNDCDGDAMEVSTNAPDTAIFYRDLDNDQFGGGQQSVRACDRPTGYSTVATDCNDANPAINPGAAEVCDGIDNNCGGGIDEGLATQAYYIDADGDGFGSSSSTAVQSCAPVTGRAANNLDCNDSNAAVRPTATEFCDGIDNNCDGVVDPGCGIVHVGLSPNASHLAPGAHLAVTLSATQPASRLVSARFAVHFDAAHLRLDSVEPPSGAPLSTETVEQIDNSAGTLLYGLASASGQNGMDSAADLARLSFTVIGGGVCHAPNLVSFGNVGTATTAFINSAGATVVPELQGLPPVSVDSSAPVLSGVPAALEIACDAGSAYGGAPAQPSVTASDDCDTALTVARTIDFADGTSSASWPADGLFPIGVSTVRFSATDLAGNTATASWTVTVGAYQLLDASLVYPGNIVHSCPRTVRIVAQGVAMLHDVQMINGRAELVGAYVPVSTNYACIQAKDPRFSLSAIAAPSIADRRYKATFALLQGDSNDDNLIDIVDFGFFYADRQAAGVPPDSRSNFNADGYVTNGDFVYIGINYFRVGDACAPPAVAPQPRNRIAVKELRREGLGRLALADLNQDGWVDARDIELFMRGGGAAAATPASSPSADVPRSDW